MLSLPPTKGDHSSALRCWEREGKELGHSPALRGLCIPPSSWTACSAPPHWRNSQHVHGSLPSSNAPLPHLLKVFVTTDSHSGPPRTGGALRSKPLSFPLLGDATFPRHSMPADPVPQQPCNNRSHATPEVIAEAQTNLAGGPLLPNASGLRRGTISYFQRGKPADFRDQWRLSLHLLQTAAKSVSPAPAFCDYLAFYKT